MRDRFREVAGHDRDLQVRDIIVKTRAEHVRNDPEFWSYFEEQMSVEPIATLARELAK